jgi:hypothetical protein
MSAPRTEILFSGSRGTAESVRLAVGRLCGCAVGGRRRANAVTHRTTFSNQFCDKCLLFPLLARLVLQTNVFENVLLLFSCVDLYYGVNIYTRQNFCHSFDAAIPLMQAVWLFRRTRRSASAAVSCFLSIGSLLPLSSYRALSMQ